MLSVFCCYSWYPNRPHPLVTIDTEGTSGASQFRFSLSPQVEITIWPRKTARSFSYVRPFSFCVSTLAACWSKFRTRRPYSPFSGFPKLASLNFDSCLPAGCVKCNPVMQMTLILAARYSPGSIEITFFDCRQATVRIPSPVDISHNIGQSRCPLGTRACTEPPSNN